MIQYNRLIVKGDLMGTIFYVIGKSATGKDSILSALLADSELNLSEIIQYTTRPMRPGETEGVQYHFIDEARTAEFDAEGKIIELRAYNTVYGVWKYMMIDDGQVAEDRAYITAGTVESYRKTADYYGEENVIPIYIYVETGERLQRALNRERMHPGPKYAEMCRRFLADENDFSDENLEKAGLKKDGEIRNLFENDIMDECVGRIKSFILSKKNGK